MKVDYVQPVELDAQQQDRLVSLCVETAGEHGGADAAIIVDFALGLFTPPVMSRLCRKIRPHVRVLTGDVSGRRASLRAMREMDLLCPSEAELRDAYGMFGQGLPAVTWKLLEETSSAAAMITLGAEGMIAFDRKPSEADPGEWRSRLRSEHVPALSAHAIDALGCGDAALALATLAMSAGASITPSIFLAGAAAAVQAQSMGNIPIGGADLRRMVNRVHSAHLSFSESARAALRREAGGSHDAGVSDTLRSA
jgi:sugar/nucleoside kinase (ribokinase family)